MAPWATTSLKVREIAINSDRINGVETCPIHTHKSFWNIIIPLYSEIWLYLFILCSFQVILSRAYLNIDPYRTPGQAHPLPLQSVILLPYCLLPTALCLRAQRLDTVPHQLPCCSRLSLPYQWRHWTAVPGPYCYPAKSVKESTCVVRTVTCHTRSGVNLDLESLRATGYKSECKLDKSKVVCAIQSNLISLKPTPNC